MKHNKSTQATLTLLSTITTLSHAGVTDVLKMNEIEPIKTYKAPTSVKEGSKMDSCLKLFKQVLATSTPTRKKMIAEFVGLGCTVTGAATYYTNCRRLCGLSEEK